MARTENPNPTGMQPNPVIPVHKEGLSIADYRKIARLGEGTFGEVWMAERGGFNVALKILKSSMSSDEVQRELRSLDTLTQLRHKNLLHTENFWSDGDRLYIEMELADGGTLKDRMKAFQAKGQEGIPPEELLKFFIEAAAALDYLHGHRPVFLHRDIKPANILLAGGVAKLGDFGLLRQVTGDHTATKTQGGTPVYMAPESIKEDRFSVGTDLFSLAVTYAELRQGKLPFFAKTQFAIFKKICEDPPELSNIFHPAERKVLLKALDKDPSKRFQSCGDFVFELNREVPWSPAAQIVHLAPPRPEKGTGSSSIPMGEPKDAAAPDFGTAKKRPPVTMQDMEVPGAGSAPSSPTANKEHDGTVSGKGSSKSSTKMGGTSDPSAGTGTGSAPKKRDPFAPITITDKKDPKTMQAYVPATKAPKNTAMRVVAALGLVGLLAGMVAVGIVVIQRGKDDDTKTTTTTTVAKDIKKTDGKPGDDGPKPPPVADAVIKDIDSAIAADNLKVATDLVEKNKAVLPDEGKPFLARIATRTKIREFLDGAEALLKKKNYAGCLDLIAKSKLTMERVQDLEQRQKHYESARDQMHQQLVGNLQAILKAKDMGKAHDAYVALTKFRDAHKKADWRPNFDEKTYPTELIAKAWKPLLADPAVPADARANLDAVLAYANPKDLERFVPDALYEKNIDALEAFVAAHYADAKTWDSAFKSVVDQLKSNKDPVELYRTLWEAIVPLRGKLRYEDLELLPATRADQQAKDASDKIFAKVIERLVTARNYEWYPDKAQAARLIVWCETRVTDPNLTLRALRAECLVRTGAKAEPLGPHPFPKDTDWYPSFVFAVVKSDSAAGSTKKSDLEDAADSMARILTTEPKAAVNPNERVGVAATLLLAPIRDFKRGGPDGKEFVNDKEAAKAVRWLTALLSLEEKKTQIPLDALVDLAFAAIKSDAPASDAVLTSIAGRMNGLKQDDKMQGYAWLAKAYRADLRAITAQPGKLHPNAISKSKRCQEFAFTSKKNLDPRVATLLYGDAVEIEANAKSANLEVVPRAKVKHDLYMAALNRAKTGKDKSFEDGFALPIVIAMLDRPYELVDADWRAAIDVGKTALKTPEEAWCGDLRATTMVRSADARLYFEMINTKSVPKDEAEALLKLYEDARKSKKYAERYSGEMPFKVGTAHYWLDNRKEAAKELAEARKIIAAIPKPYPPHLREYIDLARSDIDSMVKKKLTNVDKE